MPSLLGCISTNVFQDIGGGIAGSAEFCFQGPSVQEPPQHLDGCLAPGIGEQPPDVTTTLVGKQTEFARARPTLHVVEHGLWVCAGEPLLFRHGCCLTSDTCRRRPPSSGRRRGGSSTSPGRGPRRRSAGTSPAPCACAAPPRSAPPR